MHIYGPTHLHGAQPVGAPHMSRVAKPTTVETSGPIQDELTLSDAGDMIQQVKDLPDIRQDRVDSIRAQIEAGTYETDAKLELALERLLDEIA